MRLGIIVILLVLSLQGCGFHLKGQQSLSPVLASLEVQGGDQLARLIRGQLAELKAGAGPKPDASSARLHILSEHFSRRVLSLDSAGKAIEYELTYHASYWVDGADGKPLIETQNNQMSRSYYSSGEEELGRQGEADLIRQDMIRTMADRILRQLEVQLK